MQKVERATGQAGSSTSLQEGEGNEESPSASVRQKSDNRDSRVSAKNNMYGCRTRKEGQVRTWPRGISKCWHEATWEAGVTA